MQNAVGTKSFNGITYNTTAQTLMNVMPFGLNATINHGMISTVSMAFILLIVNFTSIGIPVDGNAVLLTVTIV